MRIVSLVPSSTETLLALGADVVACTRFCEQPGLVQVGGTKNPDIATIVSLAPDAVVMDVEENRAADAEALADAGIAVVATDVRSVDDAIAAITRLAEAADVVSPPATETAVAPAIPPWATAVVPIWRRPWMVLGQGTYGASLLACLGVEVCSPGGRYAEVELNDFGEPDLVLVPTEPYSFGERHLAELERALPAATVAVVDGQDLFWWGIRSAAAAARLADRLATIRASRRSPG